MNEFDSKSKPSLTSTSKDKLNPKPDVTAICFLIGYITILHLRADLSLTLKPHVSIMTL